MSSRGVGSSARNDRPASAGRVISFDGTAIHYDVYDVPSSVTVLVVPGFWRERRHPSMVRLARLLVGRGYRTAVLDPRGHGESEGTFGFNINEHHDVAAVASRLLDDEGTTSRIVLVGFSYGGAVSVSTVARHDLPIAALVLISPVADVGLITPRLNPFTMHRHIALSQAFRRPRFTWRMRRAAQLRALDDIREVRVPVAFLHVKNDWLIHHRHSVALYEAAHEPKELHLLDIRGNYHADRIFTVAPEVIEPILWRFLARYAS